MAINIEKLEVASLWLTFAGDSLAAIAAQAEVAQKQSDQTFDQPIALNVAALGSWLVVVADLLELWAEQISFQQENRDLAPSKHWWLDPTQLQLKANWLVVIGDLLIAIAEQVENGQENQLR